MARSAEEIRNEKRGNDLRYISDPMLWVQLVCPLIRRHKDRRNDTAYMIGDGPNIYHGNMFAASVNDRKEEFADYRAIIDAGWEVD